MKAKTNSIAAIWNIPSSLGGIKVGTHLEPNVVFDVLEKSGTWLRFAGGWVNMGAQLQYITIVNYDVVTPPPPPVSQVGNFAIISRLPDTQTDNVEVNAVALQDVAMPVNTMKGSTLFIYPSVQMRMRKVQSEDSFRWTVKPGNLWINRKYIGDALGSTASDGADPFPKAECISGYGNFVEIISKITTKGGTFYGIKANPNTDDLANHTEPFDWFYNPTLWVKQSARDRKGNIYNVADGDNSYFPLLRRTNYLWIHSTYIELFPQMPPEGTGYILRGASVYMQTAAGIKPLRLARVPGELSHPDPRWILRTKGVIPEARAEWIQP